MIVDGEVGGDEGVQERKARGFRRFDAWGRGGKAGGVLQIPVWIVFDDYDVVFYTEGVDGFTAGDGEGARGGVLADSTWYC